MKVGAYELHSFEMGDFRLDGGAMFGVVPRVLWERTNAPDEKNRIDLSTRGLMIRGNGRCLLVDAGIGDTWEPKPREMYGVHFTRSATDRTLNRLGLKAEDVTDVILSHLHFDHVGGATKFDTDGKVVLTFPKATYWIQQAQLDHANEPSVKDRASFLENLIQPLVRSGQLKTLRGNYEFAPGVTAWVTEGHTAGQQLVRVSDGTHTVLFGGDTIPTSSHIPLPYIAAYDLHPLTAIAEKEVILKRAVAENWVLFFSHDPKVAACRVKFEKGRYSAGEVVAF